MSRVENETAPAGPFAVPVVSEAVVPLDPVSRRLSDATGRVAVVMAPAGYGKTSQVAAWAHSDGRPVAWATIDRSSNDPDQFLSLLLGMLQHVAGVDPGEFASPPVEAEQYETVIASALGRFVRDCTTPFVLVLDDAHIVDRAPATDLLQAVIDNVPPESTVVLMARTVPHAALARLRAYSGLVDVSMDDLKLDGDGAQQLLGSMGVTVADEFVERLVEQTEGWPVGIRMVALAADPDDVSSQQWSIGHDHAVADFVREEWLAGMPPDAVEFLMRASCLEWLSAPMCDQVFERSDSGDMLEFWEHALMLIPLDRRGDTFRVHRLLRDVLYDTFERYDSSGRRDLDLRASEWFEQAGDIGSAIRLAVRAEDLDRAVRLVDEFAPRCLTSAELPAVNRWLGSLPAETTVSSATLCVTASALALAAGNPAAAWKWLHFADEAVASGLRCGGDSLHLESMRALLSPRPDPQTLADARHAYEHLPAGMWHAVACFGYGVLSSILGDDETAMAVLAEGAVEAQLLGAATTEAQCLANQAVVVGASNDWARAIPLARSARAVQREHGLDDLPHLVTVTSMSALVEAMSGNLASSRADIALSRRSLAHLVSVAGWLNIQARIVLAEANLLIGDHVAAQTLLEELEPLLRDNPAVTRSVEQFEHLVAQLHAGHAALPYGPSSLTAAELRLLILLPTNLTLADIAKRLFVSRNTAKSHAAAIYRKLGVSTRGEAVELARSVGLLVPDVVSPAVDRRSPPSAHRDELFEHGQIVEIAVE